MNEETIRKLRYKMEIQDLQQRIGETNKNVTIKGATDRELEKLIWRLETESRVQELLRRLNMNNMKRSDRMDADIPISTETPVKDLYHYGVLGMKWGVRRGKRTSSKQEKRTDGKIKKTKGSADYVRAKQLKKKRLKDMSNIELQEFAKRLRLENDYKQLTKAKKSKGRQFVESTLASLGKQAVGEFSKKLLANPKVQSGLDNAVNKLIRSR